VAAVLYSADRIGLTLVFLPAKVKIALAKSYQLQTPRFE
jgi:hypothetical protein